jgi:hypothetical protein
MIDHTRAFKFLGELMSEEGLGPRCQRDLLVALRELDRASLEERMHDLLTGGQIDGLLARRNLIVAHYDRRIAAYGESNVLYDLPARRAASHPSR